MTEEFELLKLKKVLMASLTNQETNDIAQVRNFLEAPARFALAFGLQR